MKKILYFVSVIFLVAFYGCNSFLDILPDDKPELKDAFKDKNNAEKYLFTCYNSIPSYANPLRTLGLTGGGEIMYYENDVNETMPDGPPSPMQAFYFGNNSANPQMNFWDGGNGGTNIWRGVRHCNVFLDYILVENGGPRDLEESLRKQWIAEVKTLKAFYHFYLFQLYGPIPIMDKATPIFEKDDDVNVYREPVDKVVDYIVGLLNEAIEDLPDISDFDPVTEYGRYTKTIARCIKAKTLVLAASPIFNNNNYYANYKDNRGVELFPFGDSKAKWERALEACDAACRSAEEDGHEILITTNAGNAAILDVHVGNINDTTKAMISLRQAVTEPWNNEVIWATNESSTAIQRHATMMSDLEWLNHGGTGTLNMGQRHAPTINFIENFYSSNGIPIDEDADWETNGWYNNRYKTQLPDAEHSKYFIKASQETAILHFNRSLRFYASVGFDGGIWEGRQKRYAESSYPSFLYGRGSGFKPPNGFGGVCMTGYLTKKLSHLKTTYTESKASLITEPYAFPIIRLADIYLLLAECLNEVGGPDKTDSQGNNAYYYLDLIRARSGMEGVVESWEKYALSRYRNKPKDISGLRDIIRRERINELAFEGHYYYDVRRWLIGEKVHNTMHYGWNIKGENKQEFYNLKFIRATKFSMRDYLMPIKINTLLQNPNLVQNPGW